MPTQTFFNLPDDKKNRIIDAAIEEFGTRNLVEGNIANIVKDSGISRGSFYQYFNSKEDLYIYIFTKLRSERSEYLSPIMQKFKKEKFLVFFKELHLREAEFLLNHPSHINLGKHLYTCPGEVCRSLVLQWQNKYKDMFLIGIEHDKSRGLIVEEVDSPSVAELLVHFSTDIFIFQALNKMLSYENVEYSTQQLVNVIENGIKPR